MKTKPVKKPLVLIAAVFCAAAFPSAAMACDFHGSFGFNGAHRFNPFAKPAGADPLDGDQTEGSIGSRFGGSVASPGETRISEAERRRRSEERAARKGTRKNSAKAATT